MRMWNERFAAFHSSISDLLTMLKRMFNTPVMMFLHCLWMVITFQEDSWVERTKQLAEEDRKKSSEKMPDQFIQGTAVTVS